MYLYRSAIMGLATQVFADEELDRLRGFPEIGRDELFRFFTLTPADAAFVDPGRDVDWRADPAVLEEEIGGLIRGDRIGWPRLRSAVAQAALPRPVGSKP